SAVENKGQVSRIERADIQFDIEAFTYPGAGAPVLRNIHLQVEAGQTLGVVGATGAGKSTLLALLLRYYDAPGARVKVGGLPVQELTLHALRDAIALVPQDPFLFTATIAENIAMGVPDASREAVRAAAELVTMDRDILRFPNGYDTLVGERGITLSGGQKQRIAIARALLLDAPILVLDDALSAVDVGTERRI